MDTEPYSALMQESNAQMVDAVIGRCEHGALSAYCTAEHEPYTTDAIAAVEKEFDFSAQYTVEGYRGMAWNAIDFCSETVEIPVEYDPDYVCSDDGNCDDFTLYGECHHTAGITEWFEYETVQNRERVLCHMVGDDATFEFDISDLTPINGEVCSCGQIGCNWE